MKRLLPSSNASLKSASSATPLRDEAIRSEQLAAPVDQPSEDLATESASLPLGSPLPLSSSARHLPELSTGIGSPLTPGHVEITDLPEETDDIEPFSTPSLPSLSSTPMPTARVSSMDEEYTGPIITPGPQYLMPSEGVIEQWPYVKRSSPPTQALRTKDRQLMDLSTTVSPVIGDRSELVSPQRTPAAETSNVPLLLPPGK